MSSCDARAGTRPSDSILGGLFPRSIFVKRASWRVSGMRDCVEQESLCTCGCINSSTHTGSHAE